MMQASDFIVVLDLLLGVAGLAPGGSGSCDPMVIRVDYHRDDYGLCMVPDIILSSSTTGSNMAKNMRSKSFDKKARKVLGWKITSSSDRVEYIS